MLANNNQKIITKLAKRSLKSNRSKYGLIITAVLLSTFMLFVVLTVGNTYFKLQHEQGIRLRGGDFDVALGNGITEKQIKACRADDELQSAGVEAYAGYAVKTDADDTLHTGLIWSDKTQWEEIKKPAIEKQEGCYPQKYNELMVTKEALKDCGKETLKPGDTFTLTFADKQGEHTEDFIISGIWEGYGPKQVFYVSEEFYKKSGYELTYNGLLNVKFKSSIVLLKDLTKLEERLRLTGRQYFMPTSDAQKSLGIFAGIVGLTVVTCMSAYLLIFNIMYLFVSGNIRYYGLLQTIGMTEKQIYHLILKQMIFVGAAGMSGGLLLGLAVSFFLIPAAVNMLGVQGTAANIAFHPAVFFGSILLVGVTLYFCSRKPAKTAARVSPTEALSLQGTAPVKKTHKTGKGHLLWRMAAEQLTKDKRRTFITMLSLAASLSVFLCLITLIKGQDAEAVTTKSYGSRDITLQNDTLWKENPDEWMPIIDTSFTDRIRKLDGVKEVHPLLAARIIVPWEPEVSDLWMRKFYELNKDYSYDLDREEYKQNPEKFYSFIKGIEEEELEELNLTLEKPVDKEKFLAGETCVLYKGGLDLDMKQLNGKNISYRPDIKNDALRQIKIAALTDDGFYAGVTGGAPIIIVSSSYMKKQVENPYNLKLMIRYNKEYDHSTETRIREIIENDPNSADISWDSKLESMEDMRKAQGNMIEIGIGIALILAWIGFMNYVNTVAVNIRTRRVALAVMESIGMTEKQLKAMLVREGVLYASGSLILTVTVGLGITFWCYESLNTQGLAFEIPLLPFGAAVLIILLLCILIPIIAYCRLAERGSIAERIREFE